MSRKLREMANQIICIRYSYIGNSNVNNNNNNHENYPLNELNFKYSNYCSNAKLKSQMIIILWAFDLLKSKRNETKKKCGHKFLIFVSSPHWFILIYTGCACASCTVYTGCSTSYDTLHCLQTTTHNGNEIKNLICTDLNCCCCYVVIVAAVFVFQLIFGFYRKIYFFLLLLFSCI